MTGIAAENVRGILLDIEGTTTSISFVYDVLFPYARQHVRKFLESHSDDANVRAIIDRLRKQHISDVQQGLDAPEWSRLRETSLRVGGNPEIAAIVRYVNWLMDRDSKAEPLKSLQGMIWKEGYDAGSVQGHVFPEVLAAFERWRMQGKKIAIFSSGSVLAQKLLFARTTAGDLSPLIDAYFDTTTGPKRDPQSYAAIANALEINSDKIFFVSDVTQELDAAAEAGMETALSIRPGNHPQPPSKHPAIRSFDEI